MATPGNLHRSHLLDLEFVAYLAIENLEKPASVAMLFALGSTSHQILVVYCSNCRKSQIIIHSDAVALVRLQFFNFCLSVVQFVFDDDVPDKEHMQDVLIFALLDGRKNNKSCLVDVFSLGNLVLLQTLQFTSVWARVQIEQHSNARWADLQLDVSMRLALRKEGILALLMVEFAEMLQKLLMFLQFTCFQMAVLFLRILLPLSTTVELQFIF